jgi:alkylated DNA nucleotide flippase Atl1
VSFLPLSFVCFSFAPTIKRAARFVGGALERIPQEIPLCSFRRIVRALGDKSSLISVS